MNSQDLLKTLFGKGMRLFLYLALLVLLGVLFYHLLTARGWNANFQLLLILTATLVIAVLGLIYLKNQFYPKPSSNPLELRRDNARFIKKLMKTMEAGGSKEELKERIAAIFSEYQNMPYSGPIYALRMDIICHLGLLGASNHDYRFKGRNFSFEEGINHYLETFRALLRSNTLRVYDPFYEMYIRWIDYKEQKIEVDTLHTNGRTYLFKDKSRDDYYFRIGFDSGHASWDEVFKVEDPAILAAVKEAVRHTNKDDMERLAHHFSNQYWARRNSR